MKNDVRNIEGKIEVRFFLRKLESWLAWLVGLLFREITCVNCFAAVPYVADRNAFNYRLNIKTHFHPEVRDVQCQMRGCARLSHRFSLFWRLSITIYMYSCTFASGNWPRRGVDAGDAEGNEKRRRFRRAPLSCVSSRLLLFPRFCARLIGPARHVDRRQRRRPWHNNTEGSHERTNTERAHKTQLLVKT